MTSAAINQLHRLRRLGFKAIDIRDEDGDIEAICWVRDSSGWREVVLVYSEQEARAYRVRLVDANTNPMYVNEDRAEVLIPLAPVVTIVDGLLALPSPAPRHSLQPRTPDAQPWTPRPSP